MDEQTARLIASHLRKSRSGEIEYFADPVNRYLRGLLEEAGEVAKACRAFGEQCPMGTRAQQLENIAEEVGDTAFMLALIASYYGIEFDRALEYSARKIVEKERPTAEASLGREVGRG